jgi:GINS complex subunit 1
MNFGQRGRDLVLECKHADLLKYNAEAVQACLEEITWHVDELTHLANAVEGDNKPSIELRPALLLHDAAIRRNKRCLLAYMNHRLEVIKENADIKKSLLSEAEVDFAQAYEKLRARYSDQFGIDVKRNLLPPTQALVQVRVLKSLGQIVLSETGATVTLQQGTVHNLPASDVQEWIQQGYLEPVEGEESY